MVWISTRIFYQHLVNEFISTFDFFFKSVAFCTKFNLLIPFFIARYDNGSPFIIITAVTETIESNFLPLRAFERQQQPERQLRLILIGVQAIIQKRDIGLCT